MRHSSLTLGCPELIQSTTIDGGSIDYNTEINIQMLAEGRVVCTPRSSVNAARELILNHLSKNYWPLLKKKYYKILHLSVIYL